jgi:hypothetical protein
MKFFSNDARENDEHDRSDSDVVTSDPVGVPQQRAGSPWSDTPSSDPSSVDADSDHRDSSFDADSDHRDSSFDADSDRRDSSFDADSDRRDSSENGSADDKLAAQEARDDVDLDLDDDRDKAVTYGPDGTVTPASSTDSDAVDSESAVKDDGTFDSPTAVDPATGDDLDSTSSSETSFDSSLDSSPDSSLDSSPDSSLDDSARERADAQAEADETVDEARADERLDETYEPPARRDDVDEPAATDLGTPVATEPTDTDVDEPAATDADAVPVVAAVPVETADSKPGSVPAPALDRLFSDGDSFADRFRDIQLRFVDTPKEATADAAALVSEAVDKLTSALNSQKDSLSSDSDDTEQLRVQLRGYRDLLNRLSAL